MIFRFTQMFFQQTGNKIKNFFQFFITQTLDQTFHEHVIRKFLQIVNDRIFIGFPVKTESDQALIVIDKFMGMIWHGLPQKLLNIDIFFYVLLKVIMKINPTIKKK